MIKLITSDIDETLVDDNRNVPEANKEAIARAQDLGKIVMLATGRGPYELRDIPDKAGIVGEDIFIICCNGAITVRAKDRQIVDSLPLDFTYAKNVFNFAYENSLQFFIYTLDKKYAINVDMDDAYINKANIELIEGDNIDFLKDQIILKALIKKRDMDFLHSIEIDVARLTNYDVEISYSSNMFMEINAKGVNKGLALEKICKHYGIDMSESMAIGDNYNDVAMIEMTGIGVAVANAHLQVKEVSDYVTKRTNNEAAVAEAIEKFVLNN